LGLLFFVWGARSGWVTPAVQEAQTNDGGLAA
jgi:hypothetical protein